jgi:2-polyprenyl-3-methyl-5-hydroxy-6-metoxy-1,4-benzoquinol methylase
MMDVMCNLCGRDDYKVRYPATGQYEVVAGHGQMLAVDAFSCTHAGYGRHPRIVQCNHCGHMYANPRWTGEELLAAYTAVEDHTYVEERIGRELTFRKHLQSMEKFTGPAALGRALLDVGAYIGVFVQVAAANGWQAWGVEPSAWAAGLAQANGLHVLHGTLDHPELQPEFFDVITMWDVIEHLDDPCSELAKAYHLLRPGGWLVVHTMDINSLIARLMGPRWPWLMDMHVQYFSQRTLAAMLRKNGFEVVWSGAQGRYLRLNYVASRLVGLNRYLGALATKVVHGLQLGSTAVPVNFGDLFTVYARRPDEGHNS